MASNCCCSIDGGAVPSKRKEGIGSRKEVADIMTCGGVNGLCDAKRRSSICVKHLNSNLADLNSCTDSFMLESQ